MGWEVGDLALAITRKRDDVWIVGGCYTVSAFFPETETDWPALLFVGIPTPHQVGELGHGWLASCFRKITPGAKIKGFEEPRRVPVKHKQDA